MRGWPFDLVERMVVRSARCYLPTLPTYGIIPSERPHTKSPSRYALGIGGGSALTSSSLLCV